MDKEQNAAYIQNDFFNVDDEDDEEIKIIRSKRFAVKPMYPEDACIQMELLGHNFFVFRNAETEEVNVVYKRKGGFLLQTSCPYVNRKHASARLGT